MGKIEELSQILANQIAAGEVVERPASVVKELVENAIDAGSTQIDIYLEEAGLRKIQVVDNGEGIEASDVLNAFKRHATSKIHTRDDLFRIRSLGFRGEALPSIASVSEITLETSTGEANGTYIRLSGGEILEHKPHSLRKGTAITVENLFFNTPARLKYVKTLQTELANAGDIVNRLALSHPHIAFRLVHDGNKMLTTTGNGDLKQTIAGIYGVATAKKMLPVASQDLDFKLTGYISLPELTRASRNYVSIIINGRYIKNYVLNKAIIEGYGSKLMVGRYPLTVLQIEMDPLLVDVNVHPTKQEVRLSKEKELMILITQAIKATLAKENLIPAASDTGPFKKRTMEQRPTQLTLSPTPKSHRDQTEIVEKTGDFYVTETDTVESPPQQSISANFNKNTVLKNDLRNDTFEQTMNPELTVERTNDDSQTEDELTCKASLDSTEPEAVPGHGTIDFPELDYFGQMHGTYLFAQNTEGLYIIDQHAAQERIKYEYYREKIGDVGMDKQPLLIPIVLDYSRDEILRIKEKRAMFNDIGLELEEFGPNSLIIREHPTWYPAGEEESIIRAMVDDILSGKQVTVASFREKTAIMMSCKRSIKANHYLNEQQARALLQDLALCENPYNCPHGRPVLIHFTNQDMERLFKRIQDPH
ncbi:DNA mismatch repair protein MutL [Vagococcus penaei]|uniref:DNA mismatch repair protein MutL n=1 Tax=Vagococcus penaei TaxID=633807 RepID=A0A1Q2D6P3_9ENTE|nr:DNA mismatch repair endonuclease MutL [Vagococcus penaei]AQP53990.1 DNA mismatch repair protein MutL [Vagococcus penaei]RST99054.1 DNA mismatch repair protein MutL [Vagococcus penaei]